MFTPVQNRRLFVLAPLYVALAAFIALQFLLWKKPLEVSHSAYLTLLNIACSCMAVYGISANSRLVYAGNRHVALARNVLTVVLPVTAAIIFSYLASASSTNWLPLQMAVLYLVGAFVPLVLAGAVFMACYLCIEGLFTKPARWLFNVPPDQNVPAVHNEIDVAPVPANQDSDNGEKKKPEFPMEWPKADLSSLAGMADFKAEVLRFIAPFRGYATGNGSVADTNGILLGGPAGNGKTYMAELVAGEMGLPLIRVSGQHIQAMYVNESVENTKALFDQARKQPCVLFIDELDSVGKNRGSAVGHNEDDKVVTTLLTEIEASRKCRIVLVAATNFVDLLDPALIRDGRFDLRIDVPYPDYEARLAILLEC
jgi:hypothetical protein